MPHHPIAIQLLQYFYALGNTAATCLTDTLPPECPVNILILGCGDARKILYTVHSNRTNDSRSLSFTCCDYEPATIARNIILLTMILDDPDVTKDSLIWDIYYHIFIGRDSQRHLIDHCKKLLACSSTLTQWRESRYGQIIGFSTRDTLDRVRGLLNSYIELEKDSNKHADRSTHFLSKLKAQYTVTGQRSMSMARSAGPMLGDALAPTSDIFQKYWTTGTVYGKGESPPRNLLVNPTFVFTTVGEDFAVHYGTDPLTGFHFAEAFLPLKSPKSVNFASGVPPEDRMIKTAKSQFRTWCQSFGKRASTASPNHPLRVNFFAGEASMFCDALASRIRGTDPSDALYVSWWKSQPLILEDSEVLGCFDVIETSNLADHLGLLNLMTATAPLLSSEPYAVIYTENLLPSDAKEANFDLDNRLCGEATTMCFLLGVAPTCYLSKSTTLCSLNELFFNSNLSQGESATKSQSQQRMSWKRISASQSSSPAPTFILDINPKGFAQFLFGVFLNVSHQEGIQGLKDKALSGALASTAIFHYSRGSFVSFLRQIQPRFVNNTWKDVLKLLIDEIADDTTLLMGMNFIQEFFVQLHAQGVHTEFPLDQPQTPLNKSLERFRRAGWKDIPNLLWVLVVVPRSKLEVLTKMDRKKTRNTFLGD